MAESINLSVFASGSGTNAENIIKYFSGHKNINVNLVLSNKPYAGVLKRAQKLNVPAFVFDKNMVDSPGKMLEVLQSFNTDWIILAGYLWLVPKYLIDAYHQRILNIHPALLPKHGGKGMYGHHVHRSVLENNEKETGITIHYIDDAYDRGEIVFQAKCPVYGSDNVETLAQRVHELEYKYFPKVIEDTVLADV